VSVFVIMIGFMICLGVTVILLAGGAALIFFLSKSVVGPWNSGQLDSIIEDWAQDEGYEIVDIWEVRGRDHPFADRFGFGKKPAVVRQIEVRDRKKRLRRGWVYVRARFAGTGYSGFLSDSLEVAWET
jgi:hypothetical protein